MKITAFFNATQFHAPHWDVPYGPICFLHSFTNKETQCIINLT